MRKQRSSVTAEPSLGGSVSCSIRSTSLRFSARERSSPPATHILSRSKASSSSAQLMNGSFHSSMGELPLEDYVDDSSHPISPSEDVPRLGVERLVKRTRQLMAQETRQRTLLQEDASQQFSDLQQRHTTYLDFADSCAQLRNVRHTAMETQNRQNQQWQLQILSDAVQQAVTDEMESRRELESAEISLRRSFARLKQAEVQPLLQLDAIYRLAHVEQVRRALLYREEAREVDEFGIPNFIALPISAAPIPATFGAGRGGDPRRNLMGMEKIDLMAHQRCPFLCAAHCPYMPQRTRQLGERWAAAITASRGRRRVAVAEAVTALLPKMTQNRQFQTPVAPSTLQRRRAASPVVTDVGKQRICNAMLKEHYSATTSFLPMLRP